ncbi:CoA ester lyase [Parafrankia sp. EUN1f]|uniref:HpcH/HpaI aldolase/citrate lyase family protein n=1 Tax=Parafrankia sp. EUN1f TaxID=102897 RepID=UPI0001C4566A|nr:CoA ester lyase [Parafrankia sp. EUN1f]EFC82355.1 HpcH/HpaI aldolase [Parafrankia sp. EUN1f]
MSIRSWLYVPGSDATKLAKALDRGADALIVDLEDAVPPSGKDAARTLVRDWLHTLPDPPAGATAAGTTAAGTTAPGGTAAAAARRPDRPRIWVRVNPGSLRARDVAALADAPNLDGLCLAKTDHAEEVAAVDAELTRAGSTAAVAPLLETPAAITRAAQIAAAPRVRHLQIGEADLRACLGVELGPDESELLGVRSQIVLASAVAGIMPPVAPVSVVYNDPDGLRTSTDRLRRLGFLGRACIHPAQIPVVNEVFTPGAEQVRRARVLIERFEAAGGAAAAGDGSMVDEAVIRGARRVLATHLALTDPGSRPGMEQS